MRIRTLTRLTAAVTLAVAGTLSHAQGIPVIDVANLVQTVQQVMNDITKIQNQVDQIQNQVQQIQQMREQLASINGMRSLGNVYNSQALRNYVPPEAYTVINAVDRGGYSGMSGTAKTLRDASMVYNCMDRSAADRARCQAELAAPYQQKGLLQDGMKAASGRIGQIQSLMDQVNATSDQKAIQEIQARIGAENAQLAHEATQLQMLLGMGDSEERIARSRDRERQHEMLARTGRIADHLR